MFTTGGRSLALKLGIPDISVQTFPVFASTWAIPPVVMPNLPNDALNYLFHLFITQIFWHAGNIGFRRLCNAAPEPIDLELHWPFAPDENRHMTPLVLACSPTIIARPDDWSSPHIPGYLFLDLPASYQPPVELDAFLAAGEPPICVTFGSTIHRCPKRIYHAVLDALEKTENRAVILSGWSDLHNFPLPDNLLVMDAVPHDWLFPRCKAIIHHGGAGTTAAGLRAGVPTIILPSAADQPFWGTRVHAVGVGPQPISVKKLTAEKLFAALIEADNDVFRNGAQAIERKMRTEDAVGGKVNIIKDYAAKWHETTKSVEY